MKKSITNDYKNNFHKKDVKIIATIGFDKLSKIKEFNKNGVNIIRINGSHIKSEKDFLEILKDIETIISKSKCSNIDIMYDTQGPEIRTRIINNHNIDSKEAYYDVKKNDEITVHANLSDKEIVFNRRQSLINKKKNVHIGVNYLNFIKDIKIGDVISIGNREIYTKVIDINSKKKTAKLKIVSVNHEDDNYKLTDRKHINLLGKPVSQPTFTENDKKYMSISVKAGIKYYAISFVKNKKDIIETKKMILTAFKEINPNITNKEILNKMKNIKIIAKIETKQGLDNILDIVKEADGVMVARGDLSSEIPIEEVPYAKEKIITLCSKYKKFSILATNVLESMMQNVVPSVNDIDTIVTALKLGVNAIMLSNETAIGKYDIKAIQEIKKNIDYYNNKNSNI